MALFDETTPQLNYFQKPIFGKKTLLRRPDGTRTGLSTALTAGLSWMGGLSPLGSQAFQGLDNLIQGSDGPKYLTEQDWYANNVNQSQAKATAIGSVVGGVADTVRGITEQVAGSLTGTGATAAVATGISTPQQAKSQLPAATAISTSNVVSPTDPNVSFQELLKKRSNQVMTPEQRRKNEAESLRQLNRLPTYDANADPNDWRFFSDTPPSGGVPDFLKGIRRLR